MTRFLIDADLSPRLRQLLEEYGQEAVHVKDVQLGSASDATIADFARRTGRCVFTADFDFADIREFPPRNYAGIVVLTVPRNALPAYIARVAKEFLDKLPALEPINGKLIVVELGRIRVRE